MLSLSSYEITGGLTFSDDGTIFLSHTRSVGVGLFCNLEDRISTVNCVCLTLIYHCLSLYMVFKITQVFVNASSWYTLACDCHRNSHRYTEFFDTVLWQSTFPFQIDDAGAEITTWHGGQPGQGCATPFMHFSRSNASREVVTVHRASVGDHRRHDGGAPSWPSSLGGWWWWRWRLGRLEATSWDTSHKRTSLSVLQRHPVILLTLRSPQSPTWKARSHALHWIVSLWPNDCCVWLLALLSAKWQPQRRYLVYCLALLSVHTTGVLPSHFVTFDQLNPLKGRCINWFHFATQVF